MMKLREIMKKLEISEDYIIEAVQKINQICKRCTCKECPFATVYGCVVTASPDVRVDVAVKDRIQKLLYPNRMEKVAELLDIKLYNWFTVTNVMGETRKYHLTEKGLYSDTEAASPGVLIDLFAGKAYIVEGE